MLTDAQKGYIAGIIDGEGCVHVSRDSAQNRYILKITIVTTDLELVTWFSKHTNAKCYPRKSQGSLGKRQQYNITFQNGTVKEILFQVIDSMVIKKERAQFLLDNYPLEKGYDVTKRESAYFKLREYNQGVGALNQDQPTNVAGVN